MQVLEDRIPVGALELVDGRDRLAHMAGAVLGPGGEQRGGEIGDRTAHRVAELAVRGAVVLFLDGVHTQHQPTDPVVLVGAHHPPGELHRLGDVAADHQRQESTVEQVVVLGIMRERGAIEFGGREGIAHAAGVTGGKIGARGGQARHVLWRRRLGGKLDRGDRQDGGQHAAGGEPGEARKCHWRSSMGRMLAGSAETAGFEPRMAFLRRPRNRDAAQTAALRLKPPIRAAS